MFTYTTSRKKLLRTIIIVLAALTAAALIIMAIAMSCKVVAAEKKVPIYCVSRPDNKIAVTFDCAWGNSNTDLLLSILKEYNATATFFVTGEFCDKYPDDVKKIYSAGHEIGNHSDTHPHLEGININDLIADTRECSRKIKMITGEEPKVYRAPYGEYDDNAVSTIEGMGLKMIQWSVDSIDWQEPDADTITERVLSKTESGSILLFHNDLENTAQALPDVLTKLKQKGFEFSKVSDTVYFDSYHIDSSGVQFFDAAALLPTAKYSDNYLLDEAMEIFRQNLTLQQIYNLTGGANQALLETTAPLLDEAHLAAVYEASFEELKEAVENLIAVAETEGAGSGYGLEVTNGYENTTPFFESDYPGLQETGGGEPEDYSSGYNWDNFEDYGEDLSSYFGESGYEAYSNDMTTHLPEDSAGEGSSYIINPIGQIPGISGTAGNVRIGKDDSMAPVTAAAETAAPVTTTVPVTTAATTTPPVTTTSAPVTTVTTTAASETTAVETTVSGRAIGATTEMIK